MKGFQSPPDCSCGDRTIVPHAKFSATDPTPSPVFVVVKESPITLQMDSYLPNECWESIFKFIINDDNEDYNNNRYMNTISLVSKQFLSITNALLFSLPISDSTDLCRIFRRFPNLHSLHLAPNYTSKVDKLLRKISRFPLEQLTSLHLSNHRRITLQISDLFLIAKCFPLLEELHLGYPSYCGDYTSYVDAVKALSRALIKLRKVNLSGSPINDRSLFHLLNNCKLLEEVTVFQCNKITDVGLANALRKRPTLKSLLFSTMETSKVFPTLQFIDSLVSLKGLTCLVLRNLNISDELLYSIAREGLPLTRLDLELCNGYSYAGIFCLLSKCQRIKHLNLKYVRYLNDQRIIQLSSFLGDLVSINLSYCREITYSALFALAKNCSSLNEIKMQHIGSNIVGNSDSLRKFGVYPPLKALYLVDNSWLSDEILIMVTSIFPNLQLLDLENCKGISEGICQVLRKCCKIKHLNLVYCSRVKLVGMNFVVPKLEVLNLSNTEVDDETLYWISKNCSVLLKLSLYNCNVTEKAVKHVVENCRQLRVHRCKF